MSRRPNRGPEDPLPHRVGRRAFVRMLAAGTVAGTALARDLVVDPPHAAATADAGRAPAGVVALGNAYLRDHPREADLAILLAKLPAIDTARPVRRQMPSLVPTITKDFAAGRVVTVQGWQLSRTEACAAAAVALGA